MTTKNFYTSLKQGDRGERRAEELFDHLKDRKQLLDWAKTPHYIYEHLGLDGENDYIFWNKNRSTTGLEVKTLSGASPTGYGYSTMVVEEWKDNRGTVRAGWWTATEAGHLNYIIFVNEHTNKLYWFKTVILKDYIQSKNLYKTSCRDGNVHNKGQIVKIPWECEEAGWCLTFWKNEQDEWMVNSPKENK
tara:strand:+ start:2793 stop:3362 length:570 start_codon:yes stop_codon:yes gene_type:complete